MEPTTKETTFKLRLSARDRAMLQAVADASSLSVAGVIRSLVAREARAMGIFASAKKGKK